MCLPVSSGSPDTLRYITLGYIRSFLDYAPLMYRSAGFLYTSRQICIILSSFAAVLAALRRLRPLFSALARRYVKKHPRFWATDFLMSDSCATINSKTSYLVCQGCRYFKISYLALYQSPTSYYQIGS